MEPLAVSGGAQSPGHHRGGAHLHRPLMHPAWGFPPGPGSPPPPPAPGSGSYEASVVATSLLPPGDAWAHHPMLATPAPASTQHWVKEEDPCPSAPSAGGDAHDDSGISPGRTSSSGPPSSGGSPPATAARGPDAAAPSPTQLVKNEQQDAEDESRSSPVTHEDDSSEMSEDTMDSLSRLQMALSQSGSPLGDIYNAASDEQNTLTIQCPLCSHNVTSLPSLAAHLNLHAEQKSGSDASDLQCAFCGFTTPNRDDFVTHLNSHYPNNDISVTTKPHSARRCSVCDFATKSASKLKAHLAEFHGFDPGENEMEMTDEDVNTPRVNSQGKVKTFRCKQCNFAAVTKLDFWSHSRNHIKCEKMLSCPRCPFVTEYKHHLEYHLRNHSGSKPFKCSQCSYSCVNKSMLNSHLKSHSNVYQYHCSDCNYATKYCHSLKLHLRKYAHSPAMVLNPDGSPNPLPIIDVYGTRRGPKTKKENLSHEPQTNSTSRREKSPVMSSPYPNVTISQPYLVNPSPAIIENPHQCAQCEFSTASQEIFAQHLLTAHQNGISKSRTPPILIPTPEKVIQAPHPIMIPQSNPMKEYLSWMYAQQQHAMDLYQQYKGSVLPEPIINVVANPLDLSKEVKKPEPLVNNTPPAQTSTSKNRRKGKAFKLERIVVPQDDTDDDLKPPPNKVRNNGAHLNDSKEPPPKSLPSPPAPELTPLQLALTSPPQLPPESQPLHPQSNGVVKNVNEPSPKPPNSTDEIKPESPRLVATMNGAPPSPLIPPADDQPTYNCSYCDILFRDVVMYTMHMGYHGYKDPFHCNMCGQQTADKLSFFLHIARSSHS